MARYFDAMRAEIELHGGTVEKFIGDAVMAVFGIPTLHEDDALRAVRAADGMRESLEPLNKDLERDFGVRLASRIGVNTGEVLVGPGSTDFGRVTGDAVNTAARLETAAQPGEVLIGADTYRLVRDAVDVESVEPRTVKGKAEPVECYRLVGVLAGTAAPPRAFTSPIVGRERELEDLERAFERSVQDRTCLLFTVLGAAGAGKSRLVEEFLGRVGGSAQVLVGRCLPYGEGITYWPVAQALRAAMELHDFDEPEEVRSRLDAILAGDDHADAIAARLSEVLGIAEGHSAPEETAWAIRRFLEILASERPVIAVWEDVHWAEPALLDAIDHVADWASDALDPAAVHGEARVPGLPARLGSRQAASIGADAPSAPCRRVDPAHRQPPGGRAAAHRCRRSGRRRGRREPAVRRADGVDADRRRARRPRRRWPRRRWMDACRGSVLDRRPALGRGVAGRQAGAIERRGTASDRIRLGDRQGLLRRRGPGAPPGTGPRERGAARALARAQGARPRDTIDDPRRGRVRVPAHPDPRCRVRRDPQGAPRRAAPSVRGLVRSDRRGADRGAGGDRRIPPRAGLPQS